MNISERHPLYANVRPDWSQMRDTHAGERIVKERGTIYLPATGGMTAMGLSEGQAGLAAYRSYVNRAVFHEFVSTAVRAMVGLLHRKPPTIVLPPRLEPLLKSATIYGEPMETLLRRINTEQLLTGRVGVLLDLPANAGPTAMPYFATYTAESVINWDVRVGENGRKAFDFIALDETGPQRVPGTLTWHDQIQYRVLTTGEFLRTLGMTAEGVGDKDYVVAVTTGSVDMMTAEILAPELSGRRLENIPFVVIGAVDLDPAPDAPPLIALARKAISSYRLEADYRHQLFMQAQDTLCIIGQPRIDGAAAPQVGASATLLLDQGADAKYVGVSAAGLGEMRQAVDAEKQAAAELGAQILDSLSTSSAASGEALAVRVAARTVTLNSIARAGGDGLTRLLRDAAIWAGADPDKVEVKPNLDFGEETFTADDLLKLMQSKAMGAPISNRTVHQIMRAGEFTQMDYEDELGEIEIEADPTGMPAAKQVASIAETGGTAVPTDDDAGVASGSDITTNSPTYTTT